MGLNDTFVFINTFNFNFKKKNRKKKAKFPNYFCFRHVNAVIKIKCMCLRKNGFCRCCPKLNLMFLKF